MRISRRTFVSTLQGAAFASLAGRVATAQPRPVLNVSALTLVSGASLTMAANASASAFCEVEISEGKRGIAAAKWALLANESQIDSRPSLDSAQERPGPRKYNATVILEPANVSVGLALIQEPRNQLPGRGAGRGAGATVDPRVMAGNARFVVDPASQPGSFLVMLPSDSTVELRIWPGGDTSARPVHTSKFDKVAQGAQKIPWNLQRDSGGRAPGGRYTAVIVCTPQGPGFLPINLISYFAVLP